MAARPETKEHIVEQVAAIYDWIDRQIHRHSELAGQCKACGECCDFVGFGHQLFVTTLEIVYLAAKVGGENIKRMKGSRCPYQNDGMCTVYERRFAGCRIFYCKADKDFQSILSESVLKGLRSVCTEHHIPYRYCDVATALNSFSTDICQWAGESCPVDPED